MTDLFDQATRLRDEGIARASAHAGADWSERAFDMLVEFIRQSDRPDFMTEDVRVYARKRLEEPPDLRAWGGVATRAVRRRLIEKVGYRQHKDPARHRGASTVWRILKK